MRRAEARRRSAWRAARARPGILASFRGNLGRSAAIIAASAVLLFAGVGLGTAGAQGVPLRERLYDWAPLPELPEHLGVAGACAGVSHDVLLVAGGAHFPVPLFEGGKKVWTANVYALENAEGEPRWRRASDLGEPRGYAASLTVGDDVLCIGGGNAERHFADVLSLRWQDGRVVPGRQLPPLPHPLAFASAARVGETIYVASGLRAPGDSVAQRAFWALDLSAREPSWRALPAWPGPARYDAVAGAADGAFYLFSGVQPQPDGEGGQRYHFLKDAYRYTPEGGWQRLADLPWSVAAAPSPAAPFGPSHLLVFGGNDGVLVPRVRELKERHPGFRREVLAYHTLTDTWSVLDTLPSAQVNTPLVAWGERLVLPSGEVRPGTRTPAIYEARPAPRVQTAFGWLDYLVLAAYFGMLSWIGVHFARRERNDDDFFLGGGRIPAWAAGASIFGTQLSAITFMAIPAKAYAADWVYILGQASIVLLAPVIVYLYLPFFRRLKVKTAYEYLERRFNLAVRLFGSTTFILLQIGRMAIVIFLPSLALSAATGFNIYLGIVLMGVVTTLYSALGGIEAVVWTDVLQVAVLLGGALLSLVIITLSVDGGLGGLLGTAEAAGKFHTFNWTWDYTTTAVWVVLFGNLLGNLVPFTADQAVVQRYLTTRDEAAAARSIWTNAALTVPAALIFFGLGTALYVFYRQHPALLDPSLQTDAIFPLFIVEQLPTGISGLLIAGLFAAAMSTLSSSMNSVSAAVVTDFYHRLMPRTTERSRLRLAQWLTVVLGVIATGGGLLLATFSVPSLWDLFLEMIGLLGGGLAGLFALGIFTRRANGAGALIGAASSAVVLYLVRATTAVHFFLYAAIGILTCFIIGYLASLLVPQNNRGSLEGLTVYSMRARNETNPASAHRGEPSVSAPAL